MNPKRVLIVDDSPILVQALKNVITGAGYQVLQAEDGAEAVSTVRRERPDLMLLDITFPPDVAHGGGVPWDGFLIMTWIKRMEECRHIPVLIISGGEPEKYKKRALDAGAVGYFQKPVEPAELITTIEKLIGKATAEGSLSEQPAASAAPTPLKMA